MTPNWNPGAVDVEGVADELAILRVLAANSQAITDGDRAAYIATFEAGATVSFWDQEVHGAAAIGDYFDQQQRAMRVHDVIVNTVVQRTGDTASVVGTGLVIPAERAPLSILAQTTIRSELARSGSIWRIRRQSKRADASFDPSRGTATDLLNILERRLDAASQDRRR